MGERRERRIATLVMGVLDRGVSVASNRPATNQDLTAHAGLSCEQVLSSVSGTRE